MRDTTAHMSQKGAGGGGGREASQPASEGYLIHDSLVGVSMGRNKEILMFVNEYLFLQRLSVT